MIDKIVKSLRENLGDWETEWELHEEIRGFKMPPWLMKLWHRASGIIIVDPHVEYAPIRVLIDDEEGVECEVPYYKDELEMITKAFKEVESHLRSEKKFDLHERDQKIRRVLAEKVKKL